MGRAKAIAAVATIFLAVGGARADPDADAARPKPLRDLQACRDVMDNTARLACLDKAASAIDSAIKSQQVYFIDKAEAAATRRSIFGLTLPHLKLFGDKDDSADLITSIDSVIRSASQGRDGNWTVLLEDNSVWQQTDALPFAIDPKRGARVSVKRAALGSFKMRVSEQPPVRVRRIS